MTEKKVKDWFTMNGKHIPIYEGESKEDAVNRSIAKDNEEKKNADIERNREEADKLNGKLENLDLPAVKKLIETKYNINVDKSKNCLFSQDLPTMGDNTFKAIKSYVGEGYKGINNALYKGKTPAESTQYKTDLITNYLYNSELKEPIVTSRISDFKLFGSKADMSIDEVREYFKKNGNSITHKGFLSSKPGMLPGTFKSDTKFVTHIIVPKGKGYGALIPYYAMKHSGEKDFIIQRNSTLEYLPETIYYDNLRDRIGIVALDRGYRKD